MVVFVPLLRLVLNHPDKDRHPRPEPLVLLKEWSAVRPVSRVPEPRASDRIVRIGEAAGVGDALERHVAEDIPDCCRCVVDEQPGSTSSRRSVLGVERDQLQTLETQLTRLTEDLAVDVDLHLALVLPTMIDRRTTQSEEFVASLEDTHKGIVGPQIVQTANIGTFQTAGRTLFVVDDDELYQTGSEARDAYAQATEQLLGVIR